MTGWGLIGSQEDIEIQEAGSTIRANGPDDGTLAGKDIVYWRAPGNYLGKRVSGRTFFNLGSSYAIFILIDLHQWQIMLSNQIIE